MSFKGIAWAGNVYEKFEAMCLEVEEAMYQDTVKYMENQVQKVGVSVKKFCSEVMDDLRPLSCVDPTNLASDDSSLIPHGFTDANKKPIPNTLLKKENDDQIMSYATAEKGSSLSGYDKNLFSPQSPGIFIENKSSEKCAASKKFGVHRRPIGIKRISRNNHPSKESSRDVPASEHRRSKVADCAKTDSRLASDTTDVAASSSDINVRCESGEAVKGNALTLDHSIQSPASDKTLSSESTRQDTSRVACDDTNGASSSRVVMCEREAAMEGNTPFPDSLLESPTSEKVSSAEPVRQSQDDVAGCISPASNNLLDESTGSNMKSKVCNRECGEKVMALPEEGTSTKDGLSSFSSPPCHTEPCHEDLVASRDSVDMEFIENEEVREPSEMMLKLGESCILVDGDDLHCAPLQGTRKHKSYKKRIREALSLKLKARKNEKKQGVSSSAEESDDWELL